MSTATLSPQANSTDSAMKHEWWNSLSHGGLLLDGQRLSELLIDDPVPLNSYDQERFRRRISQFLDSPDTHRGELVRFVMEVTCGFKPPLGLWHRAGDVSKDWTRKTLTGEAIRPNHLWIGKHDSALPVFIDKEKRIGIGKGKKAVSNALQWLRQTDHRLAIVTNGQDWRLLFAGLDYEAFAQWDLSQWFSEGEPSDELNGFRSLVCPRLWAPETENAQPPLLQSVNDSRKGQAELSQVLGERVRQAVELLVRGNSAALEAYFAENTAADVSGQPTITSSDIYRAGARMIMRMVVVLFAESRERLLPRDNPIYHDSYSLGGLRDQLERVSPHRLKNSFAAYPRIISLFRLIYEGCPHPDMTIHSYGGQLFEPGNPNSEDGMLRALHLLEQGCYHHDLMNDAAVHAILDLLSRTKLKIRQGRQSTWVPSPVDFSSLDSEYIGILYEGLLDFELRQATVDNPIIFLAVGNQPALPLSTLEAMDDKALKNLLDKMKDTSSSDDDTEDDADEDGEGEPSDEANGNDDVEEDSGDNDDDSDDVRQTTRARAEAWAHRAIEVGKLITKPRGTMTEEKKLKYKDSLDRKARQIVTKVILPGEWYLVRWGGTRKGSGTFYTRPQLAVPTVHRTLRPLAYDPPLREPTALSAGESNQQQSTETDQYDLDAPIEAWTPKRPEQILDLKICDPACGSGSFPLAALRFLTEALFASLHHYDRIEYFSDRTVIDLIRDEQGDNTLAGEALPCRPEDIDFEPRTKAVLRRYVVERCIYGVDLDPLAVELCRLSLWIETLDPRLPFTFLDHKIKCGNSLIGTWFDQFMHYPPMAWMREGGDKNHSNGIHFEKEAWTKAISGTVSDIKDQLKLQIDEQLYMFTDEDLDSVQTIHDDAEKALDQIHTLGIHEVDRRATQYRALRESQAFVEAKFSLDLWCSIWFWPPEHLEHCPRVDEFYKGKLSGLAKQIVTQLAAELRFFHWQLEFPDVFSSSSDGFDAAIGNPPWDIAKPNSKEFFSALDPLYRSYGKQEAIRKQTEKFDGDVEIERRWLNYNATFRAQSNWVKYSGSPYGKRVLTDSKGKKKHQFNLGDGGRNSFATSTHRHEKWEDNRESQTGYSRELEDQRGFHHQGGGDINLYKMFLEQAHAILREDGRLGLIVPSGIYSDHGTSNLRTLFLEKCSWRWLFGFENREGIFDIHRSFKFNPIIIQKGGQTDSIRTAFMRRNLDDWEAGEQFVTDYPRTRVLQFSPRSRAILEIQSARDLEVLEKIYSNSVLLGDDSPDGWGIAYSREFDMTNDSKLFPPRGKWEERGYRPDEYSRWLKGNWQPRTPDSPAPSECKRVDIPAGIILSRDGESWISEDEIDDDRFEGYVREGNRKKQVKVDGKSIALPLYEGRMIGQFDFSEKGWVSGKGRSAVWREIEWDAKQIEPQFMMAAPVLQTALTHAHITEVKEAFGEKAAKAEDVRLQDDSYFQAWNLANQRRFAFMDVSSATNTRTMIASLLGFNPSGNKTPLLKSNRDLTALSGVLNSLPFDYQFRNRLVGTTLNYFIVAEAAVPNVSQRERELAFLSRIVTALNCGGVGQAIWWLKNLPSQNRPWRKHWACTAHERLRLRCANDAIVGAIYRFSDSDYRIAVRETDFPTNQVTKDEFSAKLFPKGLWRVNKQSPPEHRLTVLSYVAFTDLQNHVTNQNGDVVAGIESFVSQIDGEGWQLPETLRLADYGLGHDERAKQYQPVRECFGPRFYEWQREQGAEESWRECHLHARNLVGAVGYQALLDELAGKTLPQPASKGDANDPNSQQQIFNKEDHPLFAEE